ncbi:hypothetical protein A9Q84_07235 [Halobacteriovorax marinus]|uniref:Lipoprotein n=1 Tax=Halobacteriovorax marinus TaxID=97084 RepID=A0A1Y5F5I9_9BACT|nr:hypothetical protein A9Q84_07235 [Halobacteriovorax marinus]
MKKLMALVLIFLSMQSIFANEDLILKSNVGDFCFTGLEYGNKSSILKSNMTCETRDSLVMLLQAGTLTIGTITALCTWAPEPGLTKVTAAVLATTGLVVNYATFLMRRMPCNSSADRELNDYERREFLEKMCFAMDKTYNNYTEKCE